MKGKGDFIMKNIENATRATHAGAKLLDRAIKLARRHGRPDGEGNVVVRMTSGAFARAFQDVPDLRDTIDEVEARFDRIGFFLLPGEVHISLNVR